MDTKTRPINMLSKEPPSHSRALTTESEGMGTVHANRNLKKARVAILI